MSTSDVCRPSKPQNYDSYMYERFSLRCIQGCAQHSFPTDIQKDSLRYNNMCTIYWKTWIL